MGKFIKSAIDGKKQLFRKVVAVVMLFAIIASIMMSLSETHAANLGFRDLSSSHWAYSEIGNLVQLGIINGFPDGTYRPEEAVTREQFARLVVVMRHAKESTNDRIKEVLKKPETTSNNIDDR